MADDQDDDQQPATEGCPELAPRVVVFGRAIGRCQFWNRKTRIQCRRASRRGRRFCKRHGGNTSMIGPARPQFVHGRWSKLLPLALRGDSPSPLSLLDELEFVDARLADVVKRIGAGAGSWSEVRDVYDHLIAAMKSAEPAELRAALNDFRELADGSRASECLWAQSLALVERRAKLVEAERKFRLDARAVLTREQASAMAAAVVAAVTRNVRDPATLSAIMAEIRATIDPT